MKLCVTIWLLSIALLIEALKTSANETGNERGYWRDKLVRATLHSELYRLGKSPAATKLGGQQLHINSAIALER